MDTESTTKLPYEALAPDGEAKEEMMQYFVQFDVQQPVDMSREELFTIWLEEARAA